MGVVPNEYGGGATPVVTDPILSIYKLNVSNFETCTVIRTRSDGDVPAVSLYDRLNDIEAEPRPARARRVVRFENCIPLIFRNPRTVVGNCKPMRDARD